MSEQEVPSGSTAAASGGSGAPSSSPSLAGALASIVPPAISAGVSVTLVLPLAKQLPALWAAAVTAATWTAFVAPGACSLLVLAVASKTGLRDLARVVEAAKGLKTGGKD